MIQFNNIQEFVDYKKKCVFCKNDLYPTLCQGVADKLKIYNPYKNGKISFKIKNGRSGYPNIMGTIDGSTGEIKHRYEGADEFIHDFVIESIVFNTLRRNFIHMELSCDRDDCCHYYLTSSNLTIFNSKIGSFNLSWESFNVNSSWVQNDWAENKTKIYSTENVEAVPIELDLIPFDSVPKEKLLKKIQTIITFS
jgi:hypothetical protein